MSLWKRYITELFLNHFGVYWILGLLIYFGQKLTKLYTKTQTPKPNQENLKSPKYPKCPPRVYQAVMKSLSNQFLVFLPFLAIVTPLLKHRGCLDDSVFPIESWLFWLDALYKYIGYILIEDFLFYTIHRYLLHGPWFSRIHKYHHEWTNPMVFAALDSHPIEHLLTNVIPTTLGPLILGSNRVLLYWWIRMATIAGVTSHCGIYRLGAKFHDLHHQYLNGNYGVLGLMDFLKNTRLRLRTKFT